MVPTREYLKSVSVCIFNKTDRMIEMNDCLRLIQAELIQ